jgi:hypothetical protein
MVTIGYASRYKNVEFENYIKHYFNDEVEIINKICNIPENGKYISEAYNEILKESNTDIVIFLHDNIEFIDTEKYLLRVDKAIEYQFEHNLEYSIIGVGPRCQTETDIIQRDYVLHDFFYTECEEDGSGRNEKFFGPTPKYSLKLIEGDLVDGVFLAVMKSRLKERFDNSNKTFDFYDIDLCLGNLFAGSKIGITKAFNLLHYRTREEKGAWDRYFENKKPFLKRWGNRLPFKSIRKKPQLLIITPSSRRDEIIRIAKNIRDSFSEIDDVNVFWLIAYDEFNSKGNKSIDEIFDELHKINISWGFIPSGKSQQKNYGDDILKAPLISIKENCFSEIDPWVYILDDDNLICPLMVSQLRKMLDTANEKHKRVIWMSMNREDGFIDTVRRYSIYGKGAFNNYEWSYADEFMPDPSELIIKYSKLEEIDFYGNGYGYDQKLWRYFYENPNEYILPEDWHPGHWGGRGSNNFFQCYHNGDNKDALPYIKKEITENNPMSFSLVVGTNEQCDRFVLDKQEGLEVFKKHIQTPKYKYSVLTCIFGGYETLKTIKDYRDDVEYVCVTDDENLTSEQWIIKLCPDVMKRFPNTNRYTYIRFHPFDFVTSDICVIIDASMEILKDLYTPLIKNFIENDYQYGVTMHCDRSDIYEEIDAWEEVRGYDSNKTKFVKDFFMQEGYKTQGMVQSGFMIQKFGHTSNLINNLSWEINHCISENSEIYRNFQVALAYVLNKYFKDSDEIMLIHPSIIESPYVRHWTHNGNYWIEYNSKESCPCLFWDKKVEPIVLI